MPGLVRGSGKGLIYPLGILGFVCSLGWGAEGATPPRLVIPVLPAAPRLENFLTMSPQGAAARAMVKVTGFRQRNPHDGQPASQPTEAYLGYDRKNLYVVFVCFDDPQKVRARRARREDIFEDDEVEIMIDTFHDRRRAYAFQTNPLGVQWDAIWTEATQSDWGGMSDSNHFDSSFDTLWYSRGKLTDRGYVVWLAIPFRSLRFSAAQEQTWGIILYRGILRENEDDFWPPLSMKVEGRLDRAAEASGMQRISPGRNMQFIPYGLFNSFRSLNTTDPLFPTWQNRSAGGKLGLDSKFILNDSLVLDVTGNPDFSQVESDDPQVTVNQRFEVYFPEKRPFFIENTDYFRTPIDLLFTRRVVDPDFGVRLSGRLGPYGLGLLLADDKSPGETVVPTDPSFGKRASFSIARIRRDLFKQSSVGAIFTDREFNGSFNRVGGLDARLKFSNNWTGWFQSVVSSTENGGQYQAGPGSKADVERSGLHLSWEGIYNDFSPGFTTQPGFVNRVDIRELSNTLRYRFRPQHSVLLDWGPSLYTDQIWDHSGLRLDTLYQTGLSFSFKRQIYLSLQPYAPYRQRLRPVKDFASLSHNQDYGEHYTSFYAQSGLFKQATMYASYTFGDQINYLPPSALPTNLPCPQGSPPGGSGCAPYLAFNDQATAGLSLRPTNALKIENSYLLNRLKDRASGHAIFDNHILRSKCNWQISTELSLRFILQYTATLANPVLTSVPTSRQLSPQFLITYLVHPGTAVYVGYNSDLMNPLLMPGNPPRTAYRFINDNREFFIKLSYLFRF